MKIKDLDTCIFELGYLKEVDYCTFWDQYKNQIQQYL